MCSFDTKSTYIGLHNNYEIRQKKEHKTNTVWIKFSRTFDSKYVLAEMFIGCYMNEQDYMILELKT
jgi:hypothetical protein